MVEFWIAATAAFVAGTVGFLLGYVWGGIETMRDVMRDDHGGAGVLVALVLMAATLACVVFAGAAIGVGPAMH